jgi:cell wall-associated NlpC family hydrolase
VLTAQDAHHADPAVGPDRRSDASVGQRPAPVGAASVRTPVTRRRRRILAAAAETSVLLFLLGTIPAVRWLWWVALAITGAAMAYLVVLARAQHRRLAQEMAQGWLRAAHAESGWDERTWSELRGAALAEQPSGAPAPDTTRPQVTPGELLRFAGAYVLGWVLTPAVVAIRLAHGDQIDPHTHPFFARVIELQTAGRSRSLRALTLGAAAAVGVTSVGAAAASATSLPYTVHAGDTLTAIASEYGTTVQALATSNHLSDPNLVHTGQVLQVPSVAGTGAPSAPTSYTVRAGDTLAAVAARFDTSVAHLVAVNHMADPNLIFPGQVLALSGTVQPSAVAIAAPAPRGTVAAPAPRSTAVSSTPEAVVPAAAPVSVHPPVPDPAAPSIPSAAATAVRVALAQQGKPYAWGGAGPNSFDCSGLVMYAWAAAGVSLPHYTVSQYEATERITQSELQPGDLVFYNTNAGANPGHVTMYIGGGQVVTADTTGTPVRVESLTWDGAPMGFGRVR